MIIGIPQPSNIMQRVFDVLFRVGPISMEELEGMLPFDETSIKTAFCRLRRLRAISSECRDRVWYYSIRKGAERPGDGRGPKRKS